MDFGMLGCSWAWGLDQAGEHGECLSKIIGLVDWYVGWRVTRVDWEVCWEACLVDWLGLLVEWVDLMGG